MSLIHENLNSFTSLVLLSSRSCRLGFVCQCSASPTSPTLDLEPTSGSSDYWSHAFKFPPRSDSFDFTPSQVPQLKVDIVPGPVHYFRPQVYYPCNYRQKILPLLSISCFYLPGNPLPLWRAMSRPALLSAVASKIAPAHAHAPLIPLSLLNWRFYWLQA